MFQKTLPFLAIALLCLAVAGCKQKQTEAQMNAEREQQWREGQRKKAVKYYTELTQNFPDTPQAEKARERLKALGVSESAETAQK